MPGIPVPKTLKQGDFLEFEASMHNLARRCLIKKKKKEENQIHMSVLNFTCALQYTHELHVCSAVHTLNTYTHIQNNNNNVKILFKREGFVGTRSRNRPGLRNSRDYDED